MSSKSTTKYPAALQKYITATYPSPYTNPQYWDDIASDESKSVEARLRAAFQLGTKAFDKLGKATKNNALVAADHVVALMAKFEKDATQETITAALGRNDSELKAKLTAAEAREAELLARIAALEASAKPATTAPKTTKRRTVV